jgi:hypothetical protein
LPWHDHPICQLTPAKTTKFQFGSIANEDTARFNFQGQPH